MILLLLGLYWEKKFLMLTPTDFFLPNFGKETVLWSSKKDTSLVVYPYPLCMLTSEVKLIQ